MSGNYHLVWVKSCHLTVSEIDICNPALFRATAVGFFCKVCGDSNWCLLILFNDSYSAAARLLFDNKMNGKLVFH